MAGVFSIHFWVVGLHQISTKVFFRETLRPLRLLWQVVCPMLSERWTLAADPVQFVVSTSRRQRRTTDHWRQPCRWDGYTSLEELATDDMGVQLVLQTILRFRRSWLGVLLALILTLSKSILVNWNSSSIDKMRLECLDVLFCRSTVGSPRSSLSERPRFFPCRRGGCFKRSAANVFLSCVFIALSARRIAQLTSPSSNFLQQCCPGCQLGCWFNCGRCEMLG